LGHTARTASEAKRPDGKKSSASNDKAKLSPVRHPLFTAVCALWNFRLAGWSLYPLARVAAERGAGLSTLNCRRRPGAVGVGVIGCVASQCFCGSADLLRAPSSRRVQALNA
jgi:hypothetical protein